MEKRIALIIQKVAQEFPEKTAIIAKDEKCSYKKLAEYNRKVANYLIKRGIKAGERIIVEADHSLPYMYLWYGIQLLGATFVPLEKGIPENRIQEISNELGAKLVICLNKQINLQDALVLEEVIADCLQEDDIFSYYELASEELAEILFTTGTTGKSKGVMVTFENQMNIAMAGVETTNIQPDNIWLIPTPMNHAAALRKVHIAMAVGSTVCLLEGFRDIKKLFKTIYDYQVTSLYLPPSGIHLLLMLASDELAKLNGQFRFIYSSSTAYPETDKEKMRKLMPDVYMYNCFGSSEVGVVCTDEFCVSGGSIYTGSIGKPNSFSEIVLLDEEGLVMENASAQNPGLIAIRSKSVMKGYWNEPELTAQVLRNGMLVMSDLCYLAPSGEVILVGRSNDTINLGGLKVAPLEVEEIVRKAPFVDECILIPVTKRDNTSLKLLVVTKQGMVLDKELIRELITRNLEPYKLPKQIEEIDEIIKTFNGKTDRKRMIEKYA